jgi:hypothetical protein
MEQLSNRKEANKIIIKIANNNQIKKVQIQNLVLFQQVI